MSDYQDITGTRIKYLSSDPTLESSYEGQIGYNSTTGVNKALVAIEAFHSGTDLITKRFVAAGTGTATAGLVSGGDTGGDTKTGATEEFNEAVGLLSGSMNTPRSYVAGAGTQTASLGFSGYTYPPPNPCGSNACEEYDGSTWTNVNSMNVARFNSTGCGTQTSGLGWVGRSPSSSERDICEEYDETNWTTGGTLSQTKTGTVGAGSSQTAGLCFGGEGSPGNLSQTEEDAMDPLGQQVEI